MDAPARFDDAMSAGNWGVTIWSVVVYMEVVGWQMTS